MPGYRDREVRRAEWDGDGRTSDEIVGTYSLCVGAACGYHSGFRREIGLGGRLQDGTQFYVQPGEGNDITAGASLTLIP